MNKNISAQNQDDMDLPPLDENVLETQKNYNRPIYGNKGAFSLSPNVSVPYFSALLDLERVTSELKTHEEIAPSLDNVYTLAELFQREINGTRVQHEIVDGFLRAPDKIKFFNSLTVVLLPKDDKGHILESFPTYVDDKLKFEDDKFDQSFDGSSVTHSIFGGVQFSVFSKAASIARLRWDSKRVDAVAVDGQHRLKALKLWMQGRNNALTEIEKPTRISVLFLLLHKNAGFITTSQSSIKTISREIFTDLNKNAKEVDLATQIILDDRNLESCCVRSIITPKTGQTSDTLLPLSLLRWREANNRFDNSWYLNSLVNLHLIIEDAIGLKLPSEPMNSNKVRNYIRELELAVGVPDSTNSKSLKVDGVTLLDYYNQNYFDPTDEDGKDTPVAPFSAIPSSFLKEAVLGFNLNYSTWLLKILRDFKPYKQIINYAAENGLIEGEFAKYLAQPQSAKVQLKKELEHKYKENWYNTVVGQHEKKIATIKACRDTRLGEQWAFKTIFQKALVRLGKMIELGISDSERLSLGANVDDMLVFFGRLHDANLLRTYSSVSNVSHGLWTCIAVNQVNRKIKVSAQTEARIESLLRVWYFGYRYIVVERPAKNEDFYRNVFNAISPKNTQAKWLCSNDINYLLELFEKESSVLEPLRFPEEQTDDAKAETARKIGKARFVEILQAGWDAGLNSSIKVESLPHSEEDADSRI